jgi:hypothetical protein
VTDFFQLFQPGLRHWKEQQDLDKVLVVTNDEGAPGPRPLDLESGSVVLLVSRPAGGPAYDAPMEPLAPVPDTRDWTTVLQQPCPECGFDAAALDTAALGRLTADLTEPWAAVLARPDVAVRPAPQVWSPLEYGCHVRDVLLVFGQRLGQLLTEPSPRFQNWDQDATAIAERYWEADPATVADRLAAAAGHLAGLWPKVRPEEWQRTGTRSDGTVFTVASLGGYLVHELRHHLHDVGVTV